MCVCVCMPVLFLQGHGLGFVSFCTAVTTGQSLARCQGGLAADLEVEHNR